jgi:hypothetical protein
MLAVLSWGAQRVHFHQLRKGARLLRPHLMRQCQSATILAEAVRGIFIDGPENLRRSRLCSCAAGILIAKRDARALRLDIGGREGRGPDDVGSGQARYRVRYPSGHAIWMQEGQGHAGFCRKEHGLGLIPSKTDPASRV